MAAADRRGAPRRHGRADVGADAAPVDRVHSLWWTEPVRGNLGRPSRSNGPRRVRGQRVAGEERPDGGAMAGDGWGSLVWRPRV